MRRAHFHNKSLTSVKVKGHNAIKGNILTKQPQGAARATVPTEITASSLRSRQDQKVGRRPKSLEQLLGERSPIFAQSHEHVLAKKRG